MKVRRLGTEDHERAAAAIAALKGSDLDADRSDLLADRRGILLLAEMEAEPVGFLLAYLLPRIDGPRPMALLYEIEVAEDWRRRGVGRALVTELLALCARESVSKLWVLTEADNTAACGLYAALGGIADPKLQDRVFTWRFAAGA